MSSSAGDKSGRGALGLHLLDYALEMDDLIEAVRIQDAAATGK